jgi:hypothetical protein
VSKPVLVDFFCKAGGATKGYQDAGFYVIGVDIEPQPHYCGDEFIQGDAIDMLRWIVDPTRATITACYGDYEGRVIHFIVDDPALPEAGEPHDCTPTLTEKRVDWNWNVPARAVSVSRTTPERTQ